jgi:hypothetical protein
MHKKSGNHNAMVALQQFEHVPPRTMADARYSSGVVE